VPGNANLYPAKPAERIRYDCGHCFSRASTEYPWLDEFPPNNHYIHCGVHVEERDRRKGWRNHRRPIAVQTAAFRAPWG
jgi:hypothetical protein